MRGGEGGQISTAPQARFVREDRFLRVQIGEIFLVRYGRLKRHFRTRASQSRTYRYRHATAISINCAQRHSRQRLENELSWADQTDNQITMPGRKPLPTAVKKIKGTLQPCRTNRNEPRSNTTLGPAPDYMSESAKEAWQYAVTNAPPGLLSALDGAVLERGANCSGMYREALSKFNRAGVSGMIIKTPSGILRRSPST